MKKVVLILTFILNMRMTDLFLSVLVSGKLPLQNYKCQHYMIQIRCDESQINRNKDINRSINS